MNTRIEFQCWKLDYFLFFRKSRQRKSVCLCVSVLCLRVFLFILLFNFIKKSLDECAVMNMGIVLIKSAVPSWIWIRFCFIIYEYLIRNLLLLFSYARLGSRVSHCWRCAIGSLALIKREGEREKKLFFFLSTYKYLSVTFTEFNSHRSAKENIFSCYQQ